VNDDVAMLAIQNLSLQDVHPFVKWAGGKGQLLSELNRMIPTQFNTYFEPFLGGGAMFFYMMSIGMRFNACLSDINAELITAYRAVKDNVKEVIRLLQKYETEYKRYRPYCKEQQKYYFQLRNARNNNLPWSSDVEIASRLIALNKTCFNGLYRVNRRGEFNVPPGKYKNPLICDSSNLENVSKVLAGATILADDYRNATENAQKGDFIYLDPPYQPLNNTSYFTAYTKDGFDDRDQSQLANVFRKLADNGCLVLLSNSDTPSIRELYSGPYHRLFKL
jgi:DNA adenine methylase